MVIHVDRSMSDEADPPTTNRGNDMRKDQQLGLDELMIVNPSPSGTEAMFLGEDGTLYQVQGLGEEKRSKEWGNTFWAEMVRCIRCKASKRAVRLSPPKIQAKAWEKRMAARWAGLPRGRRCAL